MPMAFSDSVVWRNISLSIREMKSVDAIKNNFHMDSLCTERVRIEMKIILEYYVTCSSELRLSFTLVQFLKFT
jgi:hypothetical protein